MGQVVINQGKVFCPKCNSPINLTKAIRRHEQAFGKGSTRDLNCGSFICRDLGLCACGEALWNTVKQEGGPYAVDNGDGTGSLKGKLVGMGF
jgi:hypothetical protein